MSLEELDQILALAAKNLNEAAASVAREHLEPVNDYLAKLGDALTNVLGVQQAIHALRPALEPEFIRQRSAGSPGAGREYGEKLLESVELVGKGEIAEAVALWRTYLASEPEPAFREMAEKLLRDLEQSETGT